MRERSDRSNRRKQGKRSAKRSNGLLILIILLLIIPTLVITADAQQVGDGTIEKVDYFPNIVQHREIDTEFLATQQWQSYNLTQMRVGKAGVIVMNIDLGTNDTGFLGTELQFKLRLDFSIIDYKMPKLHTEEVLMDRTDEITLIPDREILDDTSWYLTLSVLAGDPRETEIRIDLDIASYATPPRDISPGTTAYEIDTIPIPVEYVGSGGWTYATIGSGLLMLPHNISQIKEKITFDISYTIRNINPGSSAGIGFDLNGEEHTRRLYEIYEGTITLEVEPTARMELDVLLKDAFVAVVINKIAVHIPLVLGEEELLRELPPLGIILGLVFPMIPLLINYKIGVNRADLLIREQKNEIAQIRKEEKYGT